MTRTVSSSSADVSRAKRGFKAQKTQNTSHFKSLCWSEALEREERTPTTDRDNFNQEETNLKSMIHQLKERKVSCGMIIYADVNNWKKKDDLKFSFSIRGSDLVRWKRETFYHSADMSVTFHEINILLQ